MSNYSVLKQDINNNIYENQTQQITGTVLNAILNEMTASLGAGYQFAGVATLGMNPGDPDQRVFYLAGEGIYTSFGGIQVPAGKLGVLKWDNRWTLQTIDGLGGGGANLTGYVSVASTDDLPDEGVATLGYLCGTNLYLYVGEGGDTKEGKYQDCGSFRGPQGDSVQDVEQTQTSLENGGVNKIKFTLSNGISCEFQVRNGTTSSGLFPTVEALQAAYPSPVVGQYAFVGAGFPADIYVCTTAGTWTDSGEDYDGDNVDLTDYATKAEVNQLEAKVTDLQEGIEGKDNSKTLTKEITVGQSLNFLVPISLKGGSYTVVEDQNPYETTQIFLYFKDSNNENITSGQLGSFMQDGLTLARDCVGVQFYRAGTTASSSGDLIIEFNDTTPVSGVNNDIVRVNSRIDEINNDVNGNDDSTSVSHTVTSGSTFSGREVVTINAGKYTVIEDSNPGVDGVTLYFEDAEQNVLASGGINALLNNGLTLAADCSFVRFYRSGLPSVSGILKLSFLDDNPVYGLRQEVSDGSINAILQQGTYYNGVPNNDTKRVRFSRMFKKDELPIRISIPDGSKGCNYVLFFYSTAGDYSSFLGQSNVPFNNKKELVLDDSFLVAGANGVAIAFANIEDPTNAELTVGMMEGIVYERYTLQGQLDSIIPSGGEYYGEPVTLNIRDRVNKMRMEAVITHTPTSYPYTRYNQSMAIHNGVAFCFNDTSNPDDTFCVVIDLDTKSVISRIEATPEIIGSSHLNNANFTDVYYDVFDEFPLLLLSRGDYAQGSSGDQEMYIFRITRSGDVFSFTHIKTIKHRGTYYFNPNWEYDPERRMIWGHHHIHGDWRFGNANYRKFNGTGLFFSAFPDTQYITIETNEIAAANANITITVGTRQAQQTKTVSVQSGAGINPADFVMPYALTEGGYSWISMAQTAEAFAGQYIVCACDENGNNRVPIYYGCVIRGFPAPDLRDGTEVTITDEDMTKEVEIDAGIFQGGCCFGGMLILPFSSFNTINGQPVKYLKGQCVLIVDPINGNIKTVIPSSTMENQGCAVYDGKLYVSSHNANAPEDKESFQIHSMEF